MVDIATFVLDVVKCLAAPIGRPFMYLYNYKKNIDNLQEEVEKLTNTGDEVQRKVTAAEINEEEIRKIVQDWQTRVNNTINEAQELIQDKSNNPRCLKGLCPDLKTRYKHSKKAFKLKRDDIGSLLQQEERFDEVAYTSIQSNYRTNFDKLPDDVLKLKNARDEVLRKIKKAENNVEEIKKEVKKWLEDVDSIIVEAEKLIANQSSIGTDWETRYRNNKAASELMVDNIGPLLQQEKNFDGVAHPINPPEIWLRSNEDYLAFESRNSTVRDVLDALNDENIYMIGVYGMGGLGKTTLVQEIGRKAEKDKPFDEIVFVEVTETPDTKKIQTTIANKLGLEFKDAEDESQRASKLYLRMEKKNILLIVDNIWEELELKTVGIPFEADRGRNKILMTSRNLDVLEKMGSKNNFGMGILNEEESWNLFKKMTGGVIQTPGLNSLPQDVCKECGGLPIVICTIAKALKNKIHPSDWKVALRELKAPSPTKFRGLLEKEYVKIALSYNYLRDDELKKTFLISSLFENNASISDLFKHVVGLDILEGPNLTMEDARDRLDKLIRELKDSCLLLDGFKSKQFAMHDVVRAVAVTISYTDHHVYTERNDVEREWKDKDNLRKCTKISLPGSSTVISQLWPKDLDCPDLEYFCMTDTWGSSYKIPEDFEYFCMTDTWGSSYKIPKDFFTVMPKLKVLNLFGMQQSLLQSSLDLLINLRTLCVDYSKIEDVAIIGKLKKLKVLSLRHSNYIEELPTEFGQLTQLRLLDLSYCRQLQVIAPNVISKLSQLEELYMKGCFIHWKVEVLKELKHLSQLTSLEIDIKDNKMLPKEFFSKELKRCKISMRDEWDGWDNYEFSRTFEFIYDSTMSLEELQILKNVECLRLKEFSDDDNNLSPLFNKKVIFSHLKALELKVTSSRKIWDSQPLAFMSSLTHLTLEFCRNIKYAFPFCIAKSLHTLQHLEIGHCNVLEEIVAKEEGAKVVNFAFQQVTFLKLSYLPKLTAFYNGIDTWELPMLKRLVVENCEKFTSKYLSFDENSLHISEPKSLWLDKNKIKSDLEELVLHNELRRIEWQSRFKTLKIKYDKSTNIPLELLQIFSCGKDEKHMQITLGPSSNCFQNLKVLNVSWCKGLMKLITPSTARSLVQLREMSLKDCGMLAEIVENEGDVATSTEIVFENLKNLSLRRLKSLICFCSGNYSFNFPSLEELNIKKCPNMKTFSQGILSTPKLHKIKYEWKEKDLENEGNALNNTIQGAYKKQDNSFELKLLTFQDDNSTEICYSQHPNSFYQNLTHLILSSCGNIKYAFPSSIAKSLHQLRHLKIHNCKVLEEIVAKEGANKDDNFVFPHVTSLKLENLPEFIAFYHTFGWPMLKELVVKDCGKFLTSKDLSFQENNEEDELQCSKLKSLFLNDKMNHNLEIFELSNDDTNIGWHDQSKALVITNDKSANIPLGLLQRFENMNELQVLGGQYKELFFVNLQNLEVLNVKCCIKLMKLLTPSTARSLVHLREMSIEYCEMLIEIVANEGDATTSTEIVFDNLKKLSLTMLKSLTCFCSGNYSFNFPSLEELIIYGCPNMKTFSQGILSTPKLHKVKYGSKENDLESGGSELNTIIQKEYKEKVDSNLEELTLSGRDIMSIWEGEFQESFGQVKTLELIKDEYANIPLQILKKFNSLQKLILTVSSYEEIFSFREDEEHLGALTKLKDLKLQSLFNLKCIWKQDSRLNSILQNLDCLEVQYCDNLTTLLPSLASFENLRTLRVNYCNGMQNLMSSSTAKSLVQLKELSIIGCEMMIEVIADEGDIEKSEIVFEKLKELELYHLESLICFCSGDYTLQFPNLKSLCVYNCSKMKTFSRGDLSMPKLQKLNYKYCSQSDIDTIIQQLQNDCSKLWERFPPWQKLIDS